MKEHLPALSCLERAGDSLRWRRYQVGSASRPTPVRAFGPATLSQERVGPLIRLAYGEPPSPWGKAASGGGLVILAICTIRRVKKG